MRVSLRALAPAMGLSVASLFGYRNGSIRISAKAWQKLEQAERIGGSEQPAPTATASPKSEGLEARLDRIEDVLANLAAAIQRLESKADADRGAPKTSSEDPGKKIAS